MGLGVVTNCSARLRRIAADLVGVPFDVVVTSEQADFYKPHPEPYRLALRNTGFVPAEAYLSQALLMTCLGRKKWSCPRTGITGLG